MPIFRNILLAFAIILLGFFSILSYYRIKVLIDSSNRVNHTNEVILKIEQAFSIVKDAESGQRGFFVTGDSSFSQPAIHAKEKVNKVLTEIRLLVNDNEIQLNNLNKYEIFIHSRLDNLNIARNYRYLKDYDPEIFKAYLQDGKKTMDSVRQQAAAMEQTEQILLNERKKANEHNIVLAPFFSLIVTGVLLLIVIIAFSILRRRYDEQKIIQEKLKDSEQRFKDILEFAPDAMIIIDRDGMIALVNNQAETLFGYTREQMVGKQMSFLIPEKFHSIHPHHRKNFFSNPKTRRMGEGRELFAKGNDGKEIPVEISLGPLHTGNGMLVSASIRDISEKKKSQDALIESEKLSVIASVSRTLAHEIRNPLTNINLSVELARERFSEKQDFAELEDHLNIISRNYTKIENLVRDILYSYKYEKKDFEKVDLANIIEEMLLTVSDRILIKSVSIEKDLGKDRFISADKDDLKIALTNIVINAIEAMKHGSGLLQISIEQKTGMISLTIKDNGVGMTAEDLTRIFDPYYSKKTTGLGVGLASVKSILQNHHAEMQVTSEPGKGTAFTIFFQPFPVS